MKTITGYFVLNIIRFIPAIIFALIILTIAWKYKFLSRSGLVAVFILAVLIFGFSGWKWTTPIVTFFILSSLLSKIENDNKSKIHKSFDKSSKRDFVQVLSNGGIGGLLLIVNQIYQKEILFFLYAGTIAAVCADTWATEIGTLFKSKTINILNLREVGQGVSGAVSIYGLVGAFLGAVSVSIASIFWFEFDKIFFFLIIVTAGFIGSLIDSFLGTAVQAQYKCDVCSEVTERKFHSSKKTNLISGLKWMNNDTVNFFTSISGSALTLILLRIFK